MPRSPLKTELITQVAQLHDDLADAQSRATKAESALYKTQRAFRAIVRSHDDLLETVAILVDGHTTRSGS